MDMKFEAARRQLGTATHLFLQDLDPVAAHCLAGGACEVLEHYAGKVGAKPFASLMLSNAPKMKISDLHRVQRQYWNAFKHALDLRRNERDDDVLLQSFTDEQNDHALFIGWWDYAQAANKMPIEAQAFHVWYLAKYPEKLAPGISPEKYIHIFPGLNAIGRAEQKARLRTRIGQAHADRELMTDPQTEPRSLLLSWP